MGESRKVLLMDDSEIALHFGREALAKGGFEVRTASNLAEFDAALTDWHPDVVLTDVAMPEIDGGALCRTLKSRFEGKDVPVLLFSAMPAVQLERIARECGADGFLSKMNGLERLPEQLHALCEEIVW